MYLLLANVSVGIKCKLHTSLIIRNVSGNLGEEGTNYTWKVLRCDSVSFWTKYPTCEYETKKQIRFKYNRKYVSHQNYRSKDVSMSLTELVPLFKFEFQSEDSALSALKIERLIERVKHMLMFKERRGK